MSRSFPGSCGWRKDIPGRGSSAGTGTERLRSKPKGRNEQGWRERSKREDGRRPSCEGLKDESDVFTAVFERWQ